jgi:N-formylglutamate amidohydrolase
VTETAERTLRELGYAVTRNNPYSGGFTTQNYGRPRRGIHALQIEINRALYMDEETITRKSAIAALTRDMTRVMTALGAIDRRALAAV